MALDDVRVNYAELPIILGGDFNARVGVLEKSPDEIFIGTRLCSEHHATDRTITCRGRALIEFANENGLILINGRTESDTPAKRTFLNNRGSSTIDLIFISATHLDKILDLVIDIKSCFSDHFPVECVFSTGISARDAHDECTSVLYEESKLIWKPDKLHDFQSVISSSENMFFNLDTHEINECCENLSDVIKNAAIKLDMIKVTSNRNGQGKKPWFDRECAVMKKKLNLMVKLCKKHGFHGIHSINFLAVKKQYKSLIRKKRENFYAAMRDRFANTRNHKEFWSVVRYARCRSSPICEIPLEVWEKYYSDILQEKVIENVTFYGTFDQVLDGPFSFSEIKKALTNCKCGKAPGDDGISIEFYKNLTDDWLLFVQALFNRVLEKEQYPVAWSSATLIHLYKKGVRSSPANYRGIALMNSISKIFTMGIKNRLETWAENYNIIPECQSAYRKGRNCLDNVFSLTSAIQFQLARGSKSTYGLFIDFSKAFDSVSHRILWQKLYNLGVSGKIIRILKDMYDQASLRVRVGKGDLSRRFEVGEGVLQGEVLSPILFAFFISDLEEFLRGKGCDGIFINKVVDILILMYADDIVILARNVATMRKILKVVAEYCDINKLTINTSKTQIVYFRSGGRPRKDRFCLGKEELKVVSKYCYLGVKISSSSLGCEAAKEAATKTKIAIGTIISICSNCKADSWEGTC